jgi:hypothetical protein
MSMTLSWVNSLLSGEVIVIIAAKEGLFVSVIQVTGFVSKRCQEGALEEEEG